jgi:alpha/beta superfamily hydrolase
MGYIGQSGRCLVSDIKARCSWTTWPLRSREPFGLRTALGVIALMLCLLPAATAAAQQRIDVQVGGGITQPIALYAADRAVASAILFPGSSGSLMTVRNNFLVRVAGEFAAAGITAAVADVPSDQRGGVDDTFRASQAEAADIAAIAAFLRARVAAPVWLVGTSRGSISAANAAARLGPPGISGLVLTSSVWNGGMRQVALSTIRIPTLIVHNRNDSCPASPFHGAAPALTALTAAPAKELIAVQSSSESGNPCEGKSPHGYFGIETQVVGLIAGWIKSH